MSEAVFNPNNYGGFKLGSNEPLFCMMGLNVLEDLDLALKVADHLKTVCLRLGLPFVFKASFDKANRSSIKSYRGPGLEEGLEIFHKLKQELDVPIITDIHEAEQARVVAEVADIVQIPAFLARQTDLVIAIAKASVEYERLIHVKKPQFMAPHDTKNVLSKIMEVTEQNNVIFCERGSSFGYNNLVVDMLGIQTMQKLGCPVSIDATHAVQLPGADPRTGGQSTGGRREGVPIIAKSAVAAGADAMFLEFHPDPDSAKCDGPSCLPLDGAESLLRTLKAVRESISQ